MQSGHRAHKVESSADNLRALSCYGLSKPPSPDLDKATKRQLCSLGYEILLASAAVATDPLTFG